MLNDRCAQLLDALEPIVAEGGVILDWHSCEAYPERWADLVVVLTCDHSKLWERLEKRCVTLSSPAPLVLYHHPSHSPHSPHRPRTFPPTFRTEHVIRNYHLKKIQENNEAEIMQTVLQEARDSYPPEIVVELQSETTDDMESNVSRIIQWIEAWQSNKGQAT